MANLKRLSVLIAEGDVAQNREISELLNVLGVQDIVRVYGLDPALEWLRSRAFDVLICAEQLGDDDGLQLVRDAKHASPATRCVVLLMEGAPRGASADDIETLDRPLSSARLLDFLQRAADPQGGLWCEVPELSLTDILQMYHQGGRSISVLLSGPIAGRIRLEAGEIVDAETGGLRGAPALSRLLEASSGLLRTEAAANDSTQTITAPFEHAILEATHQLDERRHDSQRVVLPEPIGDVSEPEPELDRRSSLQAYTPNPASFSAPAQSARANRQVLVAALVLVALVLIGTVGVYLGNRAENLAGASSSAEPTESSAPLRAEAPASTEGEVVRAPSARAAGSAVPSEGSDSSAASGVPSPSAAEPAGSEQEPAGSEQEPAGSEQESEAAALSQARRPREAPARAAWSFQLGIVSTPPRAIVTERGKVLGRTPLWVTIERASVARTPREFIVRLRGYLPYTLSQPDSKTHVRASVVLSPARSSSDEPTGEELNPPEESPDDMRSNAPRPRRPDLEIRLRR